MASPSQRLRCAIYTRKSTEEGLDQAFNSLDAQREACAAYVLSQQHEGWTLLPEYYDDGGYSGGNIDRPSLQQMLGDVRSGKIDVVVVYKIDRLTRSLADFSKIVEVLDAAGASFVSVTQAFNTTNSMGRLTLNVLLSFAQFEREVIAERIRDKVAASKARGMWMGGVVPLGYRVQQRKLVVVPEEASTVVEIMERYVGSDSIRDLLAELHRDGIVTKRRLLKDGSVRGGNRFERGALYHLLKNRTYVGETEHKGKIYPGEQPAIVTRELFDAVQARLAERSNPRSPRCARQTTALLAGMIRDNYGRPMSPVHANSRGRRYRYYASNISTDDRSPVRRLPAKDLDTLVCCAVADWMSNIINLKQLAPHIGAVDLKRSAELCQSQGRILRFASIEARELLQALKLSVRVAGEGIQASIDPTMLFAEADVSITPLARIELAIEASQASYGHEVRLRLDPPSDEVRPRDKNLIGLIARAFAGREELRAMSETDAAAMPTTTLRHLQRIARLSYLAPDIVKAILDRTQPRKLTARWLARIGQLPLGWTEQRAMLGFAPA